MGLLFKNNAETTLSSGINNSVTTVPVTSAAVFPTPTANDVFFATIDDGSNIEVVKVTGISSNDLTVVRAQDNTSAATFGSGAKIELRLTAKVLEMGTSSLTDLDGDTQVLVEEAADEDKIKFKTAGSEIVRMDSTGLAIGGLNPTEKLTVDGNIANSSGNMTIDVAGTIILDSSQNVDLYANGTHFAYLQNENSDFRLGPIIQDKDLIIRGNDGGTYIDGLTIDFSEAANVTVDSGNLLLGTAGKYIQVAGSSNNYWAIGSTGGVNAPGTASTTFGFHLWNGSAWDQELSLDASGNLTADGNVTAYSDERLKDNIETIENGLDKVEQLRGVTYTRDEKENIGVIAQEVEKILPEVVLTADDEMGTKSVDYGRLTAVLIEAVKDLSARVKELEGK